MGIEKIKYQELYFYARLFDWSKEVPFEVPPGRTKVGVLRKPVLGAPKLYVFRDNMSSCVLCSLSSNFFFVAEKFAAYSFKMIL